jgi:hypothetical protein
VPFVDQTEARGVAAYVRLVDAEKASRCDSRGLFYVVAAEAIQRISVKNARRKKRVQHGGNCQRVLADEKALVAPDAATDPEPLVEAPGAMEAVDPLAAQLVNLRCIAGLKMSAAAAALVVPLCTAA